MTAAGIRTAINFGTSLITVRTSRDSSNLVASASPETNNCENAISASTQQEIAKTGGRPASGELGFSDTMRGKMLFRHPLVNPAG